MTLSSRQLFWMMFTFQIGDMFLLMISTTIQKAGQDAWISHIIGSLLAIAVVYVAIKVGEQYPDKTFVNLAIGLVGKFFGIIIVILYFIQWLSVIPMIFVESANFINTILLPKTAISALYIIIILLLIYVMYQNGIETIGLMSEVFGPVILLSLVVMCLLTIPEYNFKLIFPIVVDQSLLDIGKGALSPFSFLGKSVVILVLIYFVKDGTNVVKSVLSGMAAAAIVSGILLFGVLFTFGPEVSAAMLYPVFDMTSYIFVMNFIQNVEILTVFVAMLSIFIKLTIYFFLIVHVFATLFNIKNWRTVSLFIAPVVFISSLMIPTVSSVLDYVNTFWIYLALPLHMILIPLILLIVSKIKQTYSTEK